MVIVFLPALDGLRPQWREATESLGGIDLARTGGTSRPVLLPSFLGAMLLLFANAFSAYATAKALISQGSPIVPLKIDAAISGEVITRPGQHRQGDGARHGRGRRGRAAALRPAAAEDARWLR